MALNQEIEVEQQQIFEYILRDFINTWYSWISTDQDFVEFLRPEWARMTLALDKRLRSVSLESLKKTRKRDVH